MKKTVLIFCLIILLTSCGVKEGFTTFGALQNKIENYLINVDVTDAIVSEHEFDSDEYGLVTTTSYVNDDGLIYINILQTQALVERMYEVFYIDESLIYITELNDVNEDVVEYIVLDGKLAGFNTIDGVLEEDLSDEFVLELIRYIESKL